jgi:hypothetical protein
MSLFFEGEAVGECVTWVTALYADNDFSDKFELITAQVKAIMAAKMEIRPFPDFLPGSRTRVYLRENIAYAFHIERGIVYNIATKQILQASGQASVGLLACIPSPWSAFVQTAQVW